MIIILPHTVCKWPISHWAEKWGKITTKTFCGGEKIQIAASEQHGVQCEQSKAFHGNDLILVGILCTFWLCTTWKHTKQSTMPEQKGLMLYRVCVRVCTPPCAYFPSCQWCQTKSLFEFVICLLCPGLVNFYSVKCLQGPMCII